MIHPLTGYINNSTFMQHHNLFPSNESASLPSNLPLADSLPPLFFSQRITHSANHMYIQRYTLTVQSMLYIVEQGGTLIDRFSQFYISE